MKIKPILLFSIAVLFLGIAVYDMYLWLKIASDNSKSFEQVVKEYADAHPRFIRGKFDTTILNMILLSISSILFLKTKSVNGLKTTSLILFIICCILNFWMLFSMM